MNAVRRLAEPMDAPVPPRDEESALIRLARDGDRDAYDRLVRLHMPRAYAVAYRITGNRQDAEDMVQEGFISAWRALDRFELGRPFAPWLSRIIANAGLTHARKETRRRVEALEDHQLSDRRTPIGDTLRGEVRDRFRATLATLPERQRLAVEWHDVDGFTAEEIGDQLGVPAGTVRWYIHQARQTLRKALAPLRGTVEDAHDPA